MCDEKKAPVKIILPFKDQRSARQPGELIREIGTDIHPVSSQKIGSKINPREKKPPTVNEQCVVYHFKRNLCMQMMSATHADTYINVLRNMRGLRSRNKPESNMGGTQVTDLRLKILWKCQSNLTS